MRGFPVPGVLLAASTLALVALPGSSPSAEEERPGENPVVVMETSLGTLTIELFEDKAPLSVENFLSYVNEGYYDGLIFHRVIPNFMIQGGGFTPSMEKKKTKDPIKNEATNGLKNKRGTLAMARTGVIDSATSQFFINLKDNTSLNHTARTTRGFGYCVFGKVTEGMEVVDRIRKVKTTRRGSHGDVPADPVVIKKVSLRIPSKDRSVPAPSQAAPEGGEVQQDD